MATTSAPDEHMVLALLKTQLRKAEPMQHHFSQYDTAPVGSPTRSTAFLYNAAKYEIERKHKEETLADLVGRTAPAMVARRTATGSAAEAADNDPEEEEANDADDGDYQEEADEYDEQEAEEYDEQEADEYDEQEPDDYDMEAEYSYYEDQLGLDEADREQFMAKTMDEQAECLAEWREYEQVYESGLRVQTEAGDDAPICKYWPLGTCRRGAKCPFRHYGDSGV